MVSQTAEHALRALLYLASRREDGPVPAAEIADAIGAPRNYLSKTLHALIRHGIVSARRGPRGGFRLRLPAQALSLSSVITLFDEPRSSRMCLLGGKPCGGAAPCAAHLRWSEVQSSALSPFHTTTLADLLGEPGTPPSTNGTHS